LRARASGIVDPADTMRLVLLLSFVAGSTDAIGFLGLHGLFTAHITGNIVILINHLAAGGRAGVAEMISVPVFMAIAALARLLVILAERRDSDIAPNALLGLQFVLLLGFLLLCLPLGQSFDVDSWRVVLAGMCGVAAMAVQIVFVQTAMPAAPSTVVLTANTARFAVAAVDTVAGSPKRREDAREKVTSTFPQILGFVTGCAGGGFLEWQFGLSALLLPVSLSLIALFLYIRAIR